MARLLSARVSRDATDRVASWAAGVAFMAAVTALCVGAVTNAAVPATTGFVIGVAVGAGWAVTTWIATEVFARRAA